jgi:anaphase-promoting complex subunit 5
MPADGLGLTHLALLHCDIFRECYTKGSPLEDKLKIAYRSSQLVRIHTTFVSSLC